MQGGGLIGEERWGAIAGLVEGKTAQQCAVRYKELREKIMQVAKEVQGGGAGAGRGGAGGKKVEGKIVMQTFKFEVEVPKEEAPKGRGGDDGESSRSSRAGSEHSSEYDEDEGGDEDCEFSPLPEGSNQGACQVKLNDLMLLGAGAGQALVAHVQCACSRCGECYAMTLGRGGEEEGVECKRCNRTLSMALHCDVLHAEAGGSCLGWVELRGCKVVDLLRVMLLASCEGCGAGVRLANVVRGARRESNCPSCHAAVSAGFGTLSLVHPQEEARPRPPKTK